MSSPVETIKGRLDIAELVQGYVKLQKAGVNMRGLCPFHSEKTPSFFVSPSRQTWHCFGCNKGGDAFSFLQEIEGMTFLEALTVLGERTGVEVKRERPEVRDKRAKIFDAQELSAKFYEVQLQKSDIGKRALAYLTERGLEQKTILDFRLGFAPAKDATLIAFLKGKGFSEAELADAGLLVRGKGTVRDRFRGRIMFPIMDGNDRIVGFTGRIFHRDEGPYDPKYLNSPETPIFTKRRLLYGLNRARKAIRKAGYAVLVEGQMDALMAHQVGDETTVATSGTALTEDHLVLIKRLTDTLIVAYDADQAGIDSTKRSIELALQIGMTVRIAQVPSGKDPADLIKEDAVAWRTLLDAETKPIIAFLIDAALNEHDTDDPQGKRRAVEAVLPTIARMSNAVERGQWVGELARRVQVREDALFEELKKLSSTKSVPWGSSGRSTAHARGSSEGGATGSATPDQIDTSTPEGRRRLLEEHLLSLFLLAEMLPDAEGLFVYPEHATVFDVLKKVHGKEEERDARLTAFTSALDAPHERIGERIAMRAEDLVDALDDIEAEVATSIREVRRHGIREKLDMLSIELEAAERSGNDPQIRELTEKFRSASRDLTTLAS